MMLDVCLMKLLTELVMVVSQEVGSLSPWQINAVHECLPVVRLCQPELIMCIR